jgi:hypothetical protein
VAGADGAPAGEAAGRGGAAVDRLGHEERGAGGLEVADHAAAVGAPVQENQADLHAGGPGAAEQLADDLGRRGFAADPGGGEGDAAAVADQGGGGGGVGVAGARLGLAAVDLRGVAERAAVVGDRGDVHGDDPPAAADGAGPAPGQGVSEAALQGVGGMALRSAQTPHGKGLTMRSTGDD